MSVDLPRFSGPLYFYLMNILGISAFYHDSAAALVRDGEIVAAAQEERFTRKKHDERFPESAVRYCLEAGGITNGDLDAVVFYEKPLLKFERLLETYLAFAPRGFEIVGRIVPLANMGNSASIAALRRSADLSNTCIEKKRNPSESPNRCCIAAA